jgi:hypothetical protein
MSEPRYAQQRCTIEVLIDRVRKGALQFGVIATWMNVS